MINEAIAPENKIFVNRTLNLNHIKLIGFDMDYTLVTYNVPEFEKQAYQIVKDKLVDDYDFPEEIRKFEFDPDFIIRGLVIDTYNGNILKVNRYGFVRAASHGTRFFSFSDMKKHFGPNSIDLTDNRYYTAHTLFSLAEGYLYAQLVDYYDDKNIKIDYQYLFNQVRKCLNDAHQEDKLKGEVVKNPQRFLIKDKRIASALLKFKKFGKKIALITNSDYDYSRQVMEYCFGDFLSYPWQDLFDLIIVAANKPNYFLGQQKYLRVDRETGLLSNFFGSIEFNGIYQGGNAAILEKHLKITPSEILYLGDHIMGDVVTLKETIGWRTGLVVQELADEVPALKKCFSMHTKIKETMELKEELENESLALKEKYFDRNSKYTAADKQRWEELKQAISEIDEKLTELIVGCQKYFNKYWGEVMRTGNEPSRFATLVERYACVYMSSIANLDYYSPFKYYRSQRRIMAHDPLKSEHG